MLYRYWTFCALKLVWHSVKLFVLKSDLIDVPGTKHFSIPNLNFAYVGVLVNIYGHDCKRENKLE